ncbi:MAG TPA: TonB-dependent receptor [Bacteroidales bacterium]|nr:TonB-dependent receptor [Bacteroidales bacterium]
MKRLIINYLLLFFIALNAYPLDQEQKWILRGKVTDEKGKPLTGATVIIKDTYLGITTGSVGEFIFKPLKQDIYILEVSYLGYEPVMGEIKLDRDVYHEFELKEKVISADEVMVIGNRASETTPVAYSNLGREKIKKINTGQDLPYLLSSLPSIVETSEAGAGLGYTNFRIRGTDPSRINITIDGIPINDPESQQVFWVNMPDLVSSVSDIQVQRGVGTSKNGAAAFGASVNFQTELPSDEPYAEISSTVGSFNTFKGTLKLGTGLIKDKFKFDLRLSGLTTDGYIDYSGSDHRSLFLTGLYNTAIGTFKTNIILGEEITGISWWGVPAEVLDTARKYNPAGEYTDSFGVKRYYEDQKDNYNQYHFQLLYKKSLGDYLKLSAAYHFTYGAGFFEQYKEDEALSDYGLPNWIAGPILIDKVDLVRRKWMLNNFYGGIADIKYTKNNISLSLGTGINKYIGDHFGRVIWIRYAGWTEKDYEWYFNSSSKREMNIYARFDYRLTRRLSVFADVQYRNINYIMEGEDDDMLDLGMDKEFNFFNPKGGMFMKIDPNQDLFFSLSVANREPTRANYKDAKGDPGAMPQPETLYDFEAGYNLNMSKFRAGLNLYYMHYKDQLVPTGELSNVGYPIMTNVEQSYRTGIEFSTAIKPVGFIEWDLNATLSRNRIRNFVEHYVDYITLTSEEIPMTKEIGDVNIAYSPGIICNSDIGISPLRDLDIHIISKYVGKQYFDNTNSESRIINPYLVNNLRLDYIIPTKGMKNIALQMQVNNILNSLYENNAYGGNYYIDGEEYTWAYYFPQAGINYLVRLTVSF